MAEEPWNAGGDLRRRYPPSPTGRILKLDSIRLKRFCLSGRRGLPFGKCLRPISSSCGSGLHWWKSRRCQRNKTEVGEALERSGEEMLAKNREPTVSLRWHG